MRVRASTRMHAVDVGSPEVDRTRVRKEEERDRFLANCQRERTKAPWGVVDDARVCPQPFPEAQLFARVFRTL